MDEADSSPAKNFRRYGLTPVSTDVVIILTRFQVRTWLGLVATWIDARRLQNRMKCVPGLLKSTFVVESAHSALAISIWEHESFLAQFGAEQPFHVLVANAILPRLAYGSDSKPQIWSIRAQPIAVSNNLNWDDLHLRNWCVPCDDEGAEDVIFH